MRFYDQQHRFYAGIDLHSRTMHLCVLGVGRGAKSPQLPGRGKRPGGSDPRELFGAASRLTQQQRKSRCGPKA
jgi:hypothetical protein